MIRIVTGDFFDYTAEIRVNTVNCVGVMGAGVAALFKKRYPEMFNEYVRFCNLGLVKPGEPHVWKNIEFFQERETVINFPTKIDWRNPSEYEYIEKGLLWLREYLKDKGNVTITLPALGCGHGGLEWERVKQLVFKYLDSVEANILLFDPSSSSTVTLSPEIEQKLQANNILTLTPSHILYPTKFKGKSSLNIFVQGDINRLDKALMSIIVDSKATDREKLAVKQCVDMLPIKGVSYVLGFSSGFEIDLVKMILEKEAEIVIILPCGILELKIRRDLKELWDESKITILSFTSPTQSWRSFESINSMKLRIRISDLVLITTLNFQVLKGLEIDFKNSPASLYYINYWDTKIDFFQNIEAKHIGRSPDTRLPNLSSVLESVIK